MYLGHVCRRPPCGTGHSITRESLGGRIRRGIRRPPCMWVRKPEATVPRHDSRSVDGGRPYAQKACSAGRLIPKTQRAWNARSLQDFPLPQRQLICRKCLIHMRKTAELLRCVIRGKTRACRQRRAVIHFFPTKLSTAWASPVGDQESSTYVMLLRYCLGCDG